MHHGDPSHVNGVVGQLTADHCIGDDGSIRRAVSHSSIVGRRSHANYDRDLAFVSGFSGGYEPWLFTGPYHSKDKIAIGSPISASLPVGERVWVSGATSGSRSGLKIETASGMYAGTWDRQGPAIKTVADSGWSVAEGDSGGVLYIKA